MFLLYYVYNNVYIIPLFNLNVTIMKKYYPCFMLKNRYLAIKVKNF